MRRDMDLVRKIMIELGDSQNELEASLFADERHDYQEVARHMAMMEDAGLVKVRKLRGDDCWMYAAVTEMTWDGEEFLAAARNEKVWKKVMLEAAKNAGGVPFALLTTLLQDAMAGMM